MSELIAVPLLYAEINLANHLACIQYANLGPADPREPNMNYWMRKQQLWQVPEGVARTRLCMNCAHYDNSEETLAQFPGTPGGSMLASQLPVTPKWADITGMPSAVCTRWTITCSALRTCDDWEDPCLDEDNANVAMVGPEGEMEDGM